MLVSDLPNVDKPGKHETSAQCCFNVGTPSTTMLKLWRCTLLWYHFQVLCVITAPVSLIIGSHQDASFAFIAVAILLGCCLAMGLIFVPKVT